MIYLALPESGLRNMLQSALHDAGLSPAVFSSAHDLFFAVNTQLPELLVLGATLPDADGIEFMGHLRVDARLQGLPIIMVSRHPSHEQCVAALDGGADDYVRYPFELGELLSRIRAVLRRSTLSKVGSVLEYEGITLDDERRCVSVDGKPSSLTYTEYEILKLLLRDPGEVLTRSRILERVWGTSAVGETRAVDMHIAALRRKLGTRGTLIQTMRGTGYVLSRGAN